MTRTDGNDWTGRVLRVRLEGPAHGGEFVARHEGRVVFCRGGITGELVEVLVDDDPGRAFCRATVQAVLEASPDRIDPRCAASAAGAGCCDWSHVGAGAARDFHGRVLADQVRRIGRVELPDTTVPVEVPGGDGATVGWRTVARWVTGPDGVPGVRRARSRDLVTQPCAQPDPRLTEAVLAADPGPGREVLGVLGDDGAVHVAHRAEVGPGPRGRDRGEVRGRGDAGDRGNSRGRSPRRAAATRARSRHSRAGAWELLAGPPTVTRTVGDTTWELPVDAFWQAHRSAAGHYAGQVRAAVAAAPGLGDEPVVWDLYGGAGLFTAATLQARPGARVTVVESSAASLGVVGSALGNTGRVHPVRSRVETFLGDPPGGTTSDPDVVILDPPRGGAGIAVMERIAALTPSRVVHVGCDPASLARDVGVLVAAGWTLTDLRGVAAFPGTHHVEGLAVLDPPTGG